MKNLVLLFACIVLSAAGISGQSVKSKKPNARAELRDLYINFLNASRLKDRPALDQIMTSDYTQILGDGRIRTKTVRMQETMDDRLGAIEALELKDFDVRLYGVAAVAVCKVWEQYKHSDGAVKKYDIYSTATFVKQNNKWRIAATHISMIELK